MIRVMLLTTDLQRGGLPLRVVRLAESLPGAGVEPVVGCLAGRGPLHTRLESAGIATFDCGGRGPADATCLLRLAGHIRRFSPDLIHASLFHANLAARLVGRLDRPRPILTSTVTIEVERSWHRCIEAVTWPASDCHAANSRAVADHLCHDLGFDRQRVRVIPNSLDRERIRRSAPIRRNDHGIPGGIPLLAWAGRMDPVKDLPTFVDVVAELRRLGEVHAVLLGDGPARAEIERRVRDRGLGGVIRMAPWSDEVCGWLKASGALLFPSRTEGAPNVVLEAMACGCPVVASDIPACREMLGGAGWLCPPGDVRAFTAAAREVLAGGEDVRERTSKAAQKAATEHDPGVILAMWHRLYEELLESAI